MTDMLSSKKFVVAVLAAILGLVGQMYGLSEAEIALVIAPLTAYVLGQGLADNGKEAVKMSGKVLKDGNH